MWPAACTKAQSRNSAVQLSFQERVKPHERGLITEPQDRFRNPTLYADVFDEIREMPGEAASKSCSGSARANLSGRTAPAQRVDPQKDPTFLANAPHVHRCHRAVKR